MSVCLPIHLSIDLSSYPLHISVFICKVCSIYEREERREREEGSSREVFQFFWDNFDLFLYLFMDMK